MAAENRLVHAMAQREDPFAITGSGCILTKEPDTVLAHFLERELNKVNHMDVREAVETRRSVRAFRSDPVDRATIERILNTALRAPSGGNLQPWQIVTVGGDRLRELKEAVAIRIAQSPDPDPMDYDIYPKNLGEPYSQRRFEMGNDLYALLGVTRGDIEGRSQWFRRNFEFFGAPLALFLTIDRQMGRPQWADLGILLQTIMLLLRAEGLHSCPQESWARYPATLRQHLGVDDQHIIFCGLSIGYEDESHPTGHLTTSRAEPSDVIRYLWN